MGNSRVVRDEAMVEVGEAEKGMYFLDFCGGSPGENTIEFD